MQTRPISIILIEDDTPTNYLHNQLIREWGWKGEIFIFQNTEYALKFIAEDSFFDQSMTAPGKSHLILMDINMPRVDGWEFLENFARLSEERRNIFCIIVLTTSLNPDDRERAGHIGDVCGFYNKPLTQLVFRHIIEEEFK